MKKALVIHIILISIVFITCDLFEEEKNADVLGIWTGAYGSNGTLTMEIINEKYIIIFDDAVGQNIKHGYWERKGNELELNNNSSKATLSGDKLYLFQYIDNSNNRPNTITLERKVNAPKHLTILRINNQSGKIIYNAIWNNISFYNNVNNNSLIPGNFITKDVDPGQGYVFFNFYDVNNKLINARTNQVIIISKDNKEIFIFNDYTIITEIGNIDNNTNSGQLGSFESVKE